MFLKIKEIALTPFKHLPLLQRGKDFKETLGDVDES